jgi:hypothetical protein
VALRSAPQTAALDSAELARLPRLPDTAEEIASIASTLAAVPERDTYLGRRANESEVKRADLANRKVVAFATHGLVPGELDGLAQPALALTAPEVAGVEGDGLLTMEEVLQLKLDADWVVLSACNTASGDGAGAEAISGLGRAFFYAGARSLLVSAWPVETVSAKRHAHLRVASEGAQVGSRRRAAPLDAGAAGARRGAWGRRQARVRLRASALLGAVLGGWRWKLRQCEDGFRFAA